MSFQVLDELWLGRVQGEGNGEEGFCVGMAYLWSRGLITGESTHLLRHPDVLQAKLEQARYENVASALQEINGDCNYYRLLDVELSTKALDCDVACGHDAAKKMVNSFTEASCRTAILMTWYYGRRSGCWGHFGKLIASSGHAMALIRLEGGVYLYDPNKGVFKWNPKAGMSLKSDLKHFMTVMLRYGADAKMSGALKFGPRSGNDT